jgi:hypothetical protein
LMSIGISDLAIVVMFFMVSDLLASSYSG